MKDMLFIDGFILIDVNQWGCCIRSMQHEYLHGLYTVRRQDFGAKFNLTYHNGAPVADILNSAF